MTEPGVRNVPEGDSLKGNHTGLFVRVISSLPPSACGRDLCSALVALPESKASRCDSYEVPKYAQVQPPGACNMLSRWPVSAGARFLRNAKMACRIGYG